MILSVVMCAIMTVIATGFQVAGMCIPMWWAYDTHNLRHYCGLFKIPWKTCEKDRCTVIAADFNDPDYPLDWLHYTCTLEILGSCLGGASVITIMVWLWYLGKSKTSRCIIRFLKLLAILLQAFAGMTTIIGIVIVIFYAKYSRLLWATWLCLTGALLFFVGLTITWKFPKLHIHWRSEPELTSEVSNATPLSTMSREFNEPPPPYHVAVSQNSNISSNQSSGKRSYVEISKPIYI
ncbi:uncharacterized protein LOC115223576 [Argonauta hians]